MALEGTLKDLHVQDVFQLLDLGRKSGTLRITSELRQTAATICFERGGVVAAALGSDPQPIGDVDLQPDSGMLAVHVGDPELDPTSLIAATDSGEPLFGTPQKSPEPNLVLIPILGKADELALENQPVRLTFLTGMGAFEVERTVKVPKTD